MDEESRAKRAAALEEKKRRLEALKKRRENRTLTNRGGGGGASGTGGDGRSAASSIDDSSQVNRSNAAGLDVYIDTLLNNPAPALETTPAAAPIAATADDVKTANSAAVGAPNRPPTSIVVQSVEIPPTAPAATPPPLPPPPKKVETFAAGTQTEEDDFPPPESSDIEGAVSDMADEKNDDRNEEKDHKEQDNLNGHANDAFPPPPKPMTEHEMSEALSSKPFASFLNTASKKVERLLGAPVLADLLVDAEYDDDDKLDDAAALADDSQGLTPRKRRGRRAGADDGGISTGADRLVSAKVPFECLRWTAGRDCTDLDWSPLHRELMLASYHMPSSTSSGAVGSTAVTSFTPQRDALSSSLIPRPGESRSDGLALVWSLAMPNRPEHVLTCGSPVLSSRFHATEGHLLVGGCHSGQIVVWDFRAGRLPVQRSGLVAAGSGLGGHSHPVCSMEIVEGGSGLVSAGSDGRMNFWSLSNLRDPVESLTVAGHSSVLSVAPESNTVVVGDESGCLHTVLASTAGTAQSPAASSSSSSSSRRPVRKLESGDPTEGGTGSHFGMITGLSTKVAPPRSSTSKTENRSITRGFLRGSSGLVLTCGVDWTTKLWAPAYTDVPILSFLSSSYDYMSDVQWNPAHPSVFATASSNGSLGLWNLASSLDEPISGSEGVIVDNDGTSSPASPRGINKIKWSADGRRIAVASTDKLYVLGMSDEVSRPKGDEDSRVMTNLISRGLLAED